MKAACLMLEGVLMWSLLLGKGLETRGVEGLRLATGTEALP